MSASFFSFKAIRRLVSISQFQVNAQTMAYLLVQSEGHSKDLVGWAEIQDTRVADFGQSQLAERHS